MTSRPERDRPSVLARADAEALADRTRFRIFTELRDAPVPLTVARLAEVLGLHHTSVRAHLAKLRDAGLVEETTAAPSGRGRPRRLYEVSPGSREAVGSHEGYRMLATLLARALRDGGSAEEAGRVAGARLADRMTDNPGNAGTEDTPSVLDLLSQAAEATGFRPRIDVVADGVDLVLRSCPFADVAAEDPDTICSLHLGLARGVAERLGDVEVTGLTGRDPHLAGCRLHLRPSSDAVGQRTV